MGNKSDRVKCGGVGRVEKLDISGILFGIFIANLQSPWIETCTCTCIYPLECTTPIESTTLL